MCVATSSVQHLFEKAPIAFSFSCPKLATKHRTGSDGGIRTTSNSHSGSNTNGGGEREGATKNGGGKRNATSIVVLVIESQDLSSTPPGETFDFLRV